MIEVSHLSKAYGAFYAVNDISFQVGKGEVVGFLGPNGAGKSTTLRILSGFLGMSSGKVSIGGRDILEQSAETRALVGYMPEAVPLYGEMRVVEYLKFRAELKGVGAKARRANVDRAMGEARVDDLADTLISKLSKGYRQRVGLADALVARPPILILDEPTAGLDPNQIREVRALVKDLGERHTILLSTHILSEVESTCARAIVIARGKLVAEGVLDDLRSKRRSGRARLVVRPGGGAADDDRARAAIVDLVKASPDVARAGLLPLEGPGLLGVEVVWHKKAEDPGRALEELVRRLVDKGHGVREATPAKASLDEVFAQLTEETPPGSPEAEAEGQAGGAPEPGAALGGAGEPGRKPMTP